VGSNALSRQRARPAGLGVEKQSGTVENDGTHSHAGTQKSYTVSAVWVNAVSEPARAMPNRVASLRVPQAWVAVLLANLYKSYSKCHAEP
jgi:hypothetical protein